MLEFFCTTLYIASKDQTITSAPDGGDWRISVHWNGDEATVIEPQVSQRISNLNTEMIQKMGPRLRERYELLFTPVRARAL